MTGERGSGTVWVLAFAIVVVLAAAVGGAWGLAANARHRAEAAADLAALAAAANSLYGQDRACAVARKIAHLNGSEVVRCQLSGDVAEIEVTRPLRLGSLRRWNAVATARAGPATPLALAPARFSDPASDTRCTQPVFGGFGVHPDEVASAPLALAPGRVR